MGDEYEEELRRSFWTTLREGGELYAGGGRLEKTCRRFAERLNALGVSYALVGGYALIVHGVRRFTEDIDLRVTAEGLHQVREDLIGRGYVAIPGNDRDIRDAETGVRVEFVVTGQYPGDGKEKPVAFPDPSGSSTEMGGVRVVTLPILVELKLASGMTGKGRLQDLADVQRLIQTHGLGRDFAEHLAPHVRDQYLRLLD